MCISNVLVLLVIDIRNVKKYLTSELKLSDEESVIYLFIVKNGRATSEKIAQLSKSSKYVVSNTLASLVEKGMIIESPVSEYESLHPKFAVVNRYRRVCLENNLPCKKSILIDSIGSVLERPFEDARPK